MSGTSHSLRDVPSPIPQLLCLLISPFPVTSSQYVVQTGTIRCIFIIAGYNYLSE